jgi:hypothetical protein
MVKAVPLGDASNHSNIDVENGTQGRIRFADFTLALYMNRTARWDMISGTPPPWFNKAWHEANVRSKSGERLVTGEFKNGKVYITRAQLLTERNWLIAV